MRGCPHSVECGIEAALQGPLGVADIDRLRCEAWMKRTVLVASAVSRARLRGYAELEHGVAPVQNVRHSLGFADDSDARAEEVLGAASRCGNWLLDPASIPRASDLRSFQTALEVSR
jgi:hypothetical protein